MPGTLYNQYMAWNIMIMKYPSEWEKQERTSLDGAAFLIGSRQLTLFKLSVVTFEVSASWSNQFSWNVFFVWIGQHKILLFMRVPLPFAPVPQSE